MRRTLTAGFALTLILTSSLTPSYANDAWQPVRDPSFVVDYDKGNDLIHISEDWVYATSWLVWRDSKNNYETCDNVTLDFNCGKAKSGSANGFALLPVCAEIIESCINKVWIYEASSSRSEAVFTKTVLGNTFKGYPEINVPRGDGSHVFTSTHSNSSGKGEYTVQAQVIFQTSKNSVNFNNFVVKVSPTLEKSDQFAKKATGGLCDTPDGKGYAPCVSGGTPGCIYTDPGICGQEQEFTPNTRVGIQLKLTNQLTGWIRGRLKDPVIDIQRIDSKYNLVTVDALPVEVSRFFTAASVAEGAPNLLGKPSENAHGAGLTLFEAATKRAIDIVNGYRNWAKDTSAGVTSNWTFASISGGQAGGSNSNAYRCLSDNTRLLGLVTTNAMTYEGGAPSYSGGFLNYRLAGLHYLPDGKTEVLGTYDLVMRSDVARCLYGFSKAPVSATISVIGGDDENVATTVVSEKNGWLKLAAYGFTFSEKKIKVKLTQKKSTITCVGIKNSKLVKKVTNFNPACPAGYRKKS